MSLERLWAGWRSEYVGDVVAGPASTDGSIGDRTIFERVLALPDDQGYVVHRGDSCSVLLNAYPYTNGHVMVLPNRAVPELGDLEEVERRELWSLVEDAVQALRGAFGCEGVNVGLNLGAAAGAGVPGHLHVHVLPRWAGDTNFMTSVAETRVLPESLGSSWQKLRASWPATRT